MRVTLYTRAGCHLCDQALDSLTRLRGDVEFDLDVRDVDAAEPLRSRYGERVPVIAIEGQEAFWGNIDETALRARLKGTR